MCIQLSSQPGHTSAMLVPDKTPPVKKTAPTYIRTNEFTSIFQAKSTGLELRSWKSPVKHETSGNRELGGRFLLVIVKKA